jgi:hypothetical protein
MTQAIAAGPGELRLDGDSMNTRRALARVTAVSATALAIGSGLVTTAWAGAVAVSGTPVLNNGTHTLTLTAASTYVPGPTASVILHRHGSSAAQDVLTAGATVANDTHTLTASVAFTSANPGLYDLDVYNNPTMSGSPQDSCTSCVTVVGFKPVVSSVAPATLGEGTPGTGFQNFVITGQNFTKGLYAQCTALPCTGPSVAVMHGAALDPNVVLSQTVSSSGSPAPTAPTPTAITLRVKVTGTDATPYTDDIVVTNTDDPTGKTGTCTGCLTIQPQPTISSVALTPADFPAAALANPAQIGQGATGQTLVITGNHFPADSVVVFSKPTGTSNSGTSVINVAHTVVADNGAAPDTITLTGVDTTGVAATGVWGVAVSSPSLHNRSAVSPLTVNPAPVATAVSFPDSSTASYGQGAQSVKVDVSVDNTAPFFAGDGITPSSTPHTLVRFTGLTGATILDQKAIAGPGNSPNTVEVTLSLAEGAPTGSFGIVAVNPEGGTSAACDNGAVPALNTCLFAVSAGPTVTSVSPNTVAGGFSGPLTIKGTGFHTGTNNVKVRIGTAGSPLFVGNATASNATTITTGTVGVPAGTSPADLDVVVTNNDDKGAGTGHAFFHITNLTLDHASPAAGSNDAGEDPLPVAISGNEIAADATAKLVKTGAADIVGSSPVMSNSGGTLTATFDLRNVSPGVYDVVVTNPTGANAGTAVCGGCFTVLANAPTISTVAPTALGGGAQNVNVTVTGTNIYPGASLVFSNAKVHPVGSPTITAPGQIQQLVSVDSDATPGAGTVKVHNSDGQESATSLFTVDSAPTISSISPSTHAAGTTFPFTVNGTNYANGATLDLSDDSIDVSNVQVTATKITADLTVPASVVAGGSPVAVHVSVLNPDHGQATSATDLTLDPTPSISSLDPSRAATGTSFTLHINGSHFVSGATVTSPDSALAISGVTFVSDHEVDATVDSTGASVGNHPVMLDNGDGGTASKSLAIFTKPTVPGGPTVTPHDGSMTVAWTAPSSDGGDAITSYTVTLTKHSDGSGVASYTTPDASTLSKTFSPLTNGTTYDVAVVATNGAGNSTPATGSGTPAFATTLTIHASSSKVTFGKSVTLSGHLTRSDSSGAAGASVKVFRKLAGSSSTTLLSTVQTDSSGQWTFTGKPARNAAYSARFAGDSADLASSSSTVSVAVKPLVAITSPKGGSSHPSSQVLVVRGKVLPSKARDVVKLVATRGKTTKVFSGHLSSTSHFTFSVRLAKGTWHLHAVVPRTTDNAAGRSASRAVTLT